MEWRKLSFWRCIARTLFKVLLAVGFIAQSAKFLEMYLEYPAILELDVTQPHEVELPAFTICNLNEIRITPYCKKYPQKCDTIQNSKEMCKLYPEYCRLQGDATKLLPKHRIAKYNLTPTEQREMGHQLEDLLVDCKIVIDGKEENCKENDYYFDTGDPILISTLSHSNSMPFNCYVMYSLHGQATKKPKMVPISTVIRLHLNLEVGEYHPEHLSRGAQISIHSPYHIPSPMSEGQLLNLGTIYRFYITMNRLELLPAPYKSRCRDYMSEWRANGGKGPLTQKMCKEKCKLDKSMEIHKCADPRINYPHNETRCEEEILGFTKKWRDFCAEGCSIPCSFSRFNLDTQISNSEGFRNACTVPKDLTCATLVQLFFENMEVTTFTYKQKFEPVGILSWIGGYVGLWLGISLLTVYDFLETRVFRVLSAFRKKYFRNARKKRKKGPDPYKNPLYVPKMHRRF
ncbi:hypothetical protein JTE90_026580 [Oedothorax gibbosus]|uniref:Uncharacterized protein n=1 Tax=Oedothorax gibbosus TaxID=931172 RepID=A0AAV6TZ87_9ARAC|nr:hypothetical protein JTE90_026580 [Oedothorax gibbosus]